LSAPQEIVELVERFSSRINEYRSSQYNETELRGEFVNPFFAALGWDVHNRQGLSSDSKEVKLEESIRMEESIKNPDYSFRLGKSRRFFVETKKPSINIEGGVYPAFQLRRYAWSASLAVSILTDFEEFAVYDCRAEPSKTDKPGKGRLLYLQYDQYVERWDEIAALFSKEAVLGGSLERFIESIPEKRGIKRVDAALLEEISLWREALARSIALHNPALSQRDLNFSVQRTIDRLLFLRICEDRAIEEYGRLKALLKVEGVYVHLLQLFAEADERYNSGIFHFQEERERKESPDSLTTALVIDDATLKEIIQDLYFPDSPYVFSEIPAEILGQVYEQFLGKVIRLEEGHKAIVEDKPEVRKAGGVYYTPPYIVEYIVKNTVGKLLQDNTPAKAAQLRLLDPACGSGSFLIGAYQFLLDWHMDWYRANLVPLLEKNQSTASPEVLRLLPAAPEQRSDRRARKIHARAAQASLPIFKANGNEWSLTTTERKRILQSNIYGVDIDPQAVEVTKLSLLLKVLEGETEESISSLLRYFKERALPDLGSNIKCGNSLIGYDYYDDHKNLSTEEVQRINAFEWKTEFPEIFERGGFDAVIGNPPYIENRLLLQSTVDYFHGNYQSAGGRLNTFSLFIEQSINQLDNGGRLGVIIHRNAIKSNYYHKLREFILNTTCVEEIVDLKGGIFEGVTGEMVILILVKECEAKKRNAIQTKILSKIKDLSKNEFERSEINQDFFNKLPGYRLNIYISKDDVKLLTKIEQNSIPLIKIAETKQGIIVGDESKYISNSEINDKYKKILRGRNIGRYKINYKGDYLYYDNKALTRAREQRIFECKKKILTQHVSDKIIAALDEDQYYALQTINVVLMKDTCLSVEYILALLNSKLLNFYYEKYFNMGADFTTAVATENLNTLPIYNLNFNDKSCRGFHDNLSQLAIQISEFNKKLDNSLNEFEKLLITRQIEATDRQIDRLVYELYGLTEEEIGIVENAAK